jgi:lysozyme
MSLHPDYPIQGADISVYQGRMDFVIADSKLHFIYIRAGSAYLGGDMKDAQFDRNQTESKGKLPRGFYFVFRAEVDVKQQMNHFLQLLDDDPGELPPALDVERNDEKLSPTVFTNKLIESISILEHSPKLGGDKAALYTSASFWNLNVQSGRINYRNRTLWVANYHSDPTQVLPKPLLPRDWPYWTLWQLSADRNGLGKEFGAQSYSIDLDVFNGDKAEFTAWFGVAPNDLSETGGTDPTVDPPKYVVTRANINLRNGPGVSYTKIGSALKNSRWPVAAVVQGADGLWVKIAEQVYIAYWLCDPIY